MNKDRGLGKGLGALLGDAALKTQEGGSVMLPISQVEPGIKQPRKRFDEESLSDLAESIRTHGLIQPLTVRRLSSGYYQIIAGERRWRASKQAGLTEVPAVIIEADDRKVMELGLIENLQREDLNPIEEAGGYKVLVEEYGLTQEEVARQVGKSRSAVANAMRLLSLPDAVRMLLEEGRLSAGHARAILSVPGGELQKRLAQKVVEEDLSVRQTEAMAKRISQAAIELARRYDVVFMEGAGGLMVPLTPELLTIDYIAQQHYPLLFVTSGKLGSVSHTLLSLEAIKRRGIRLHTMLYNLYPTLPDPTIQDDTRLYLKQYLAKHFPDAGWIEVPVISLNESPI